MIDLFSGYDLALRTDRVGSTLEFFEKGFELSSDDRLKFFDIKFSPWIRELCRWFDDPETQFINLFCGSQISKTLFMMGLLLYVSQNIPGAVPCFWCSSNKEEAKQFVAKRLRFFLDNAGGINDNDFSSTYFKVFNSSVKVGWASAKSAMRSKPCRFVFGDEVGVWIETIAYALKRTRTFGEKAKGVFATTPPEDEKHHSLGTMLSALFYQWWIPCHSCGFEQALTWPQIKWEPKEPWTARLICKNCKKEIEEKRKVEWLNAGKAVCVDTENYERIDKPEKNRSKTMQISGLYSVFTKFSTLAETFIKNNKEGIKAQKTFFTDELAQIPKNIKKSKIKIDRQILSRFIDSSRDSGIKEEKYRLYTMGVDVQRSDVYYVLSGWEAGTIPSGHVLEYGFMNWKGLNGAIDWNQLIELYEKYRDYVYAIGIDSSDGVVTQDIYDLCSSMGARWIPIKDIGKLSKSTPSGHNKVYFKAVQSRRNNKQYRVLFVNSASIKDDIAAAFTRVPGSQGSWSFHSATEEEFLKHLSNEYREDDNFISSWKPKYSGAPQHWLSSLVYSTAIMETSRKKLIQKRNHEISSNDPRGPFKVVNRGEV